MRFSFAPLFLVLATAAFALSPVDIGGPSIAGSAIEKLGTWEVTAGGKDIWGTSDQFTYLCANRTGDFDIAVKLEALSAAQLYSRMGLMARESLDPRSAHVFLAAFAENKPRHNNNGGIELQYRNSKGGPSAALYPPAGALPPAAMVYYPNTWLRLKRTGITFSAYTSQDGKLWLPYGSVVVPLPGTVYVGVAVTSHDAAKPTQARFRDFQDVDPVLAQ